MLWLRFEKQNPQPFFYLHVGATNLNVIFGFLGIFFRFRLVVQW